MDYDDQLRLDCVKTGDPLNKRFSRAPDTSVDALAKEFEDEMEMELDCVFQKQQNTWSTITTAAPRTSIEAPGPSSNSKYDDDYFDSSDDEKVTDRRVKSNDELLYDPAADDQDEQWMAQRGTLVEKAPNSDAVLNCPRLVSTLTLFLWNVKTKNKEVKHCRKSVFMFHRNSIWFKRYTSIIQLHERSLRRLSTPRHLPHTVPRHVRH